MVGSGGAVGAAAPDANSLADGVRVGGRVRVVVIVVVVVVVRVVLRTSTSLDLARGMLERCCCCSCVLFRRRCCCCCLSCCSILRSSCFCCSCCCCCLSSCVCKCCACCCCSTTSTARFMIVITFDDAPLFVAACLAESLGFADLLVLLFKRIVFVVVVVDCC